jgi:GT2 family glycosyltransferase
MWESPDLLSSSSDIPKLTIGLVNHNAFDQSIWLLRQVITELKDFKLDVIVVDNSTSAVKAAHFETEILRLRRPECDVLLIRQTENHLGSARQKLIEHGRGDYLLVLDPDAGLPPGWSLRSLTELLKARTQDPRIAGMSGFSKIPASAGVWAESLLELQDFYWMNLGSPQLVAEVDPDHLPCTAVWYPMHELRRAGGFSPRLRISGEDLELGLRLRDLNLKFQLKADLDFVHHTQSQDLAAWLRRVWKLGLGRSAVLKMRPRQIVKPAHFFPLLAGLGLLGLVIWPQIFLALAIVYLFFLALTYRKLRSPDRAMILTVTTQVAYCLAQWVGLFRRLPKPPVKAEFSVPQDAFAEGQIRSKIQLCEQLEMLNREFRDIYVLAGWAGVLPLTIYTRGKLKFRRIILIDRDAKACAAARKINNALECQARFETRVLDLSADWVRGIAWHPQDLVINTSLEHFYDLAWFRKIPGDVLCALQGSDLPHPEHVLKIENVEQLKTQVLNLGPRAVTVGSGFMEISYPNLTYHRITWIGFRGE